jgi:hypothetical protein
MEMSRSEQAGVTTTSTAATGEGESRHDKSHPSHMIAVKEEGSRLHQKSQEWFSVHETLVRGD